MEHMGINYLAVLAAGVVAMIIGGLWYGPLFGKTFIRAMGWENRSPREKKEMQKGMMWSYLWQFVVALIMFYVLDRFMNATGYITVFGGLVVAFWVWIGFIIPLKLGDALWGGKMTLFWLGIFNSFFTLAAGAAIIGFWH